MKPFRVDPIGKKTELLKLASTGAPRPKSLTALGGALMNYTREKSCAFDREFCARVMRAAPMWFGKQKRTEERKRHCLALARTGAARPSWKTQLGRELLDFCRDPAYSKMIKAAAPRWFLPKSTLNKEKLLQLARQGAVRPTHDSLLARSLLTYTCVANPRGRYDKAFDVRIRKLAPAWFVKNSDRKKKELMHLAMQGTATARPKAKTELGACLGRSTRPKDKNFDPKFNSAIRKIAPHWFTVDWMHRPR
jgi:hypothetical protein